MSDILKKFSEAAKTVSSNNNLKRVGVYGAYFYHLRDIDPDDLPENIQIIFESVVDRLRSTRPIGDLGEDEAGHLVVDILHIADVLKTNTRKP